MQHRHYGINSLKNTLEKLIMQIGFVPYKLRKTKNLGQLHVDQLVWPKKKPSDKLHVRGPVGAEHLTSFKYVVRGNGQLRP